MRPFVQGCLSAPASEAGGVGSGIAGEAVVLVPEPDTLREGCIVNGVVAVVVDAVIACVSL
jgi:hypothetical protein